MRQLLAELNRDRTPRWLGPFLFLVSFVFAFGSPTEIDPWDLGYVWDGYFWFFSDPSVLHEQQIGCYVSNLIGASLMHGFGRYSAIAFALLVAVLATPCALALRRLLRPVLPEPMCSASILVGLAASSYVGLPWCYRSLPFYSGLSALFALAFLLVLVHAVCENRPALFLWAGTLFPLLALTRLNNALLLLTTLVLPFDSLVRRRGLELRRYVAAGGLFLAGVCLGGLLLLAAILALGHGPLVIEGLRTLLADHDTYGGWSNHFYFHRATLLEPKKLVWSLTMAAGTLAFFGVLGWLRPQLVARRGLLIAVVVAIVPHFFNSNIFHIRLPALWWWLFLLLAAVALVRGRRPPAWRVFVLGALLLVLLFPLGAMSSAYILVGKNFLLVVPIVVAVMLDLAGDCTQLILRPTVQTLMITTFAAMAVFPPLVRAWEGRQYRDAGFVVRETGGIPVRYYSLYRDQLDQAVTQLRELHTTYPGRLLTWEHLPQLHALTGIAPLPHTGGWTSMVSPPAHLADLLRTYRHEVGLVFQQKQPLFPADASTVTPGYTYSVPYLESFLPAHRRPPANSRQTAYDAFVETLADFELLVDRPTYRIYGRKAHI